MSENLRAIQIIYLIALTIVAIFFAIFILNSNHNLNQQNEKLRKTATQQKISQLIDCVRSNNIAMNQKIVIQTLIDDRKTKPGFLLYKDPVRRARSIRELTTALHRIRIIDCQVR